MIIVLSIDSFFYFLLFFLLEFNLPTCSITPSAHPAKCPTQCPSPSHPNTQPTSPSTTSCSFPRVRCLSCFVTFTDILFFNKFTDAQMTLGRKQRPGEISHHYKLMTFSFYLILLCLVFFLVPIVIFSFWKI